MCGRATLSLIAGLLLCACQSETITGVRLAIRYDAAPERLRVFARANDGSAYGPELLPDPPRPLAAGSESVLLQLTDALHDRTLALEVEGLDSHAVVMARGNQRVRVVSGAIVDIEVRLNAAPGCGDDRLLLSDGSCALSDLADAAPSEPSADASQPNAGPPDASTSDAGALDGGCGVRCTDASRPVDVVSGASAPDTGNPVIDVGCAASAVCGDGVCGMPACGDGKCCIDCREPKCELTCATGASCDWNCAGADECKSKCSSDSTCLVDCTDVNNCRTECAADAVCKLDCTGANNCRSKCGPNSECTVDCAGANNCDEIECQRGAACTVRCGDAENCKFKRCDGVQTECPDGTLVCGRDCP